MNEWSIAAVNLPLHSQNPIHTDAGAQAQGFERALVAGVTTYAYLCHPPLAHWGLEWARAGTMEVRFRSPVFDAELIRICPTLHGESFNLDVLVPRSEKALVTALAGPPVPKRIAQPARSGEKLVTVRRELTGQYGAEYAESAGDDLTLCREAGVVHPATWPMLANDVFHTQLVHGSWIHTRSIVRHHALAIAGDVATIETTVVERFSRSGQRAIADVVIAVGETVVATIEHEAIIDLDQ